MIINQTASNPLPRSAPFPCALLDTLSPNADAAVRTALSHGEVDEALCLALDAPDLEVATDVLRIGWFALLHRRIRASAERLESLSTSELTSHPLLAMALGLRYNADAFRREKAAHYFGLAATGMRTLGSRISSAERALVLASESAAFRLLGKTAMSVRSARAALAALEEVRGDETAVIGDLPRLYAQLGSSLYYGFQEKEALQVLSRGYAEGGPDDPASFGNISMAAGIHALAGDLREAADYVDLARDERWGDEQRSQYTGIFYRLAEAVLALEAFDPASAREHLGAMEHDRRSIEHWVAIARVEARAALLEGDPARGLAELEGVVVLRGAEGTSSANRLRLASARSILHLALGNFEAATTVLARDAGNAPQDRVDRARLALATGRTSVALREVRAIAGRTQNSRTRVEALTIESAVGLRVGHGDRTTAVLHQLIAALRYSGQRLALLLLPQADVDAVTAEVRRLGGADVLPPEGVTSFLRTPEHPALTPRESDALAALTRTGSVSAIAAELGVSTNTAKSQLRSLYRKLEARNREEALTVAMHRHLIPATED